MSGVARTLRRTLSLIILTVALWPGAAVLAADAEDVLTDDDGACLDCHGSEENAAKHAKGDRKIPVIDLAAYIRSVHNDAGCDGCHDKIKLPAHPGKVRPAADAPRKLPGAVIPVCRSCHAKVVKAFDRSYHAELLRARKKSAPDCNDCHAPHAVTSASVQDGPKNVCLECHDDPAVTHRTWLPNAARHLETVSCVTCHAPDALARVDLRLIPKSGKTGGDIAVAFEALALKADTNRDGLDANEFHGLLETLERQGTPVSVQGRIELRNGVQAHWVPEKSRALRDCFGCHDEDAPPYKRVTVSTLDDFGGPVSYDAQRGILTSAINIEALKGFYALGGTRLALLDVLLALGLAFGISVPALHFAARRLLKRPSAKKESTP